jgi:hypothetical protein
MLSQLGKVLSSAHKLFQFFKEFFVFARKTIPGLLQAENTARLQSRNNFHNGIEVIQ